MSELQATVRSTANNSPMTHERKYFLDWLRIIAFGMLILFHLGLLYVTWGYNIKSPRIYPDLELLMTALEPWRMTLLFFIAGVASAFLLDKLGPGHFALDRVRRLLVVFIVGMFLINPMQVYVEFLHKDLISPGYLDFWLNAYLPGEPFPNRTLPNWDHLWFLLYLLVYSLGFAALCGAMGRRPTILLPVCVLLIAPALWFSVANVLIEEFSPVTQTLVNDWAAHLRWIGIFATGVLCAKHEAFWQYIRGTRQRILLLCLIGLFLHIGNALLWRAGLLDPLWDGIAYGVIKGLYGWTAVLTLLGYASHHLQRDSRALRYLTDAALPLYVVHQPILLAAAFLMFPLALPAGLEAMLIVLCTAAGSFAVYELPVRRWLPVRVLFGLKAVPGEMPTQTVHELSAPKAR